MKHDVINIEGKKITNVELSEKIFSLKPNRDIIKSIIDFQINNYKSRTAKTKQRGEITGSTRKIYAQKGTGGARHSSRKAPIFIGGGIAHGPKGDNYKVKKINKKMRKIALAQTISKKKTNKELYIIEDVKKQVKKTKIFYSFLSKNKINNVLIISDKETEKNISKSVRNIPNVKLINHEGANVYDLVKFKNVLFTTTSIKKIQDRILNEKN